MDRRNFLLGVLGAAGAVAATSALASKAEAAPLLDQLKAMDAGAAPNPLNDAADLPAEGAQETQFYRRRRGPVFVRRRPFVVRRRPFVRFVRPARCRWFRGPFGRLYRRCF
jgi:hypothetical protein